MVHCLPLGAKGGFVLSAESSSPIEVFVEAPGKTYTVQVDRNQRAMCLYLRLKALSGMQQ